MSEGLDFLCNMARARYCLLPLYGITDGICQCGNLQCSSPGKHPRLRFDEASANVEQVRAWHQRYPDANWGMTLNGLVVVDEDPRNGGDLNALPQRLPDSCTQRTGGGGRHVIFTARPSARYGAAIAPGVDLKHGAHALIVIEPSVHASGGRYVFLDESEPFRQTPAPAPQWLESPPRAAAAMQPPAQSVTAALLKRLRSMMPYWGSAEHYDEWLRPGMGLHAATRGAEAGFGLWCEWASQSEKFDIKQARAKWVSFRAAGGITLATLEHMARSNGWREPICDDTPPADEWTDRPLSLPGGVAAPDLPADLFARPLRDMVQAVAESLQVPTALPGLVGLAVTAIAVQRRYIVQPKASDPGYVEPLALWVLPAAASGERKTPTLGAMTAPLVAHEKFLQRTMQLAVAEAAAAREVATRRIEALGRRAAQEDDDAERVRLRDEIARLRREMPPEVFPPRLLVGDVTPERAQAMLAEQGERLGVVSDEGGFLRVALGGHYSGGAAHVDVFLQAHAGSPARVDRAGRSAYLENPSMSIALAVQPGILKEAASSAHFRDAGLLARFLFAVPESRVGRRDVRRGSAIPMAVREAYHGAIDALLADFTQPLPAARRLTFSAVAQEIWFAFAEDIERRQGPGGDLAEMCDWTAKAPGAIARMAALMQLLDSGPDVRTVDGENMARAAKLGRLLIEHARLAFGLIGSDGVEADARALLAWVVEQGPQGEHNVRTPQGRLPCTVLRQVARKALLGRFRTLDRFTVAAARLAEWNAFSPERKQRNEGARPSPYYRVNPQLFVAKVP